MNIVKRDRKGINHWLIDAELTVTKIAEKIGVAHTVVSNTFAGRRSDRKVLPFALEKGCPAKHLNLPQDMRSAA